MTDRRKDARRPYRLTVTSSCGEIDGQTTNVSDGGFLMQNRSAQPLKVGQSYALRLRRGTLSLDAVAQVIDSRDDIFFENGALEFTHLSRAARNQIQEITGCSQSKAAKPVGIGRVALVQRPPKDRNSVDRIG